MSTTENESCKSDTWLSEELFAHLKAFNSEFKNKPAPFLQPEVEPQVLKKTRLDSFQSAFGQNALPTCDATTDLLDLGDNNIVQICDAAVLDFTPSKEGEVQLEDVEVEEAAEETVINEDNIPIPTIFETPEEELKLLKFLESKPMQGYKEPQMYMQSELPSTAYRLIKCSNCHSLFDIISFQSHICDYDEYNKFIVQPPQSTVKTSVKKEPLLPADPACIRLLRENQIRIRRFLKDELKYDVNSSKNNSSSGLSMSSNSGNSSSTLGNYTTTMSSTPNTSINSSKKQDGPHECTLCDRKFVHASGLLRHMEKHAMDLIPTPGAGASGKTGTAQGANPLHMENGLRVVIKCTLCGRIFLEPESALKHILDHFPNTEKDEQELENGNDVQYETYIDDAMAILTNEEKDGTVVPMSIASGNTPNSALGNALIAETTNNQGEKPYLKMIILSCILQCEFCEFIFSEVSYLFVHSACHLVERRFECFSCNIYYRSAKEITTHWQTECVFMRENLKIHLTTMQRYFACNVCENKFQSLEQLHEHRYTSYHFFPRFNKSFTELQLPCEYCDAVLNCAQECVAHYEEKHFKKYKRDKDSTGSSSKTRQYLCDICGKSYTQSSHLWQHLRFHQGVKPFACKEPGCTRKFTIRPDLNDHIRKCHTGERPYHCLVCGKRFLTGSVFYQHRLIHRGERRYECEECGKRFYRADALKNHQRIHTGEKPFGCLFCTKNFRQRGDRDKHIRARHSHLDANARLMMQMQKLQLEAAAAAAAAAKAAQQQDAPPPSAQPESTLPNEPCCSSTAAAAAAAPVNEKIVNEKIVNEKIVKEKIVNEKIVKEKIVNEKIVNEKIVNEKTVHEKTVNEKTVNEKPESEELSYDSSEVVMVGNVAFPRSMFQTFVTDIDDEATLRTIVGMK